VLDLSWSDRPDHDPPASPRLMCHAHRVLGDALPLHGALEYALKHPGDLLHAGRREAIALELCEELVEHGGTQLAQLDAADVRQDVTVPQRLVRPQGLWLEVRNGVGDEPLLPELGERHATRVHEAELPQPPHSAYFGVELRRPACGRAFWSGSCCVRRASGRARPWCRRRERPARRSCFAPFSCTQHRPEATRRRRPPGGPALTRSGGCARDRICGHPAAELLLRDSQPRTNPEGEQLPTLDRPVDGLA
jgi:hypothetical protein